MVKDLEVIKSTLTCIHIIMGNNPEKELVFDSANDLLKSISKCLDTDSNVDKSGFYGKELLDSFTNSLNWMKSKGIITPVKKNDSKCEGSIKVDKNKLVEHIVNSGL